MTNISCGKVTATSILNDLTTIECLPDEILLEILEYLSIRDLFNIFYYLNYRFRTLLECLGNLHAEILLVDEFYTDAFDVFRQRIRILTLHEMNVRDMSTISNIRSLRLNTEPNQKQCEKIAQLSKLESLVVVRPKMNHFYYSVSLAEFIFNNRFRNVIRCQMNLIRYRECQNWLGSTTLRYLSVCLENPRVYRQILEICPNLVEFQVRFVPNFARPPKQFENCSSHRLKHLEILFDQTMFSICDCLSLFFSLVPDLIEFRLETTSPEVHSMDLNHFSRVLHEFLWKLSILHVNISIENVQIENIEEIKQLHRCFKYFLVKPATKTQTARLITDFCRK